MFGQEDTFSKLLLEERTSVPVSVVTVVQLKRRIANEVKEGPQLEGYHFSLEAVLSKDQATICINTCVHAAHICMYLYICI